MITNCVFEKERITHPYVYWQDAFDDKEILKIDNYCNVDVSHASIVGENNLEETKKIRKSFVNFIERNDNSFWIFDRFNEVIDSLNKKFYNFDLIGYDKFQYTVYKGEEGGKYDWHMDTILGQLCDDMKSTYTRKLSVIMLLSDPEKDFTGGRFEYHLGNENNAVNINIKKGTIIAFPSFICHRVTPVYAGVRKSIVIWVEGPKFK